MPRHKLLPKREVGKRGAFDERCTYPVVVPLIGKALLMPEEFIIKPMRLRRR
jgi:hypothetical protein